MELNEAKLHEFLGKMVQDLGAAATASLVITGDKLGLYKALAANGPVSSDELAKRTGTSERYVREWLAAQAASGYVEYDAAENSFSMTPEQIAVFADDESPVNMTGGYYSLSAVMADEPKVSEAFQSGEGISWGDHDSDPMSWLCNRYERRRSNWQYLKSQYHAEGNGTIQLHDQWDCCQRNWSAIRFEC